MNILNFPDFTLVNRVVPKVAFYSHLEVTARMKSAFIENVEQVVWLYKLAPSNLHVTDGKDVHELTIFLIKLKRGFQTALTSSVILIASYPDIRFSSFNRITDISYW